MGEVPGDAQSEAADRRASGARAGSWRALRTVVPLAFVCVSIRLAGADFHFDGSMPEDVLRSYLSRSMTLMRLLTGAGSWEDNLRMMRETGVKFAGRATYNWGREEGGESALPKRLEVVRFHAAAIHSIDPEIILQACVFEIVSRDVNQLQVPAWVFEELGRPVERRNFRFEEMGYPNGRGRDQWGPETCIPDVGRPETALWFHYLAGSYIDAGCEAIHFGQAEIMNGNDPDGTHWAAVLKNARKHAKTRARRHFILCDAHVPHGGLSISGRLLLDFHSFPLRIEEVADHPREGRLEVGFADSFYRRSRGGVTPSGWSCEHLPYLVELDNYGHSSSPGKAGTGRFWVGGWDEITWFSQQSEAYRNQWLTNASAWVRNNDPAGYLEMPGMRCLSGRPDGKQWYFVNRPGPGFTEGFGQEDAIRRVWNKAAP